MLPHQKQFFGIMYEAYQQYLDSLKEQHKCRSIDVARAGINDKDWLDFSTNDYLNLSKNSTVINAAIAATLEYGAGATGSRLLSGNLDLYTKFEATIAADKNTEASLIFSSGFQANLSALSCLLDQKILGTKPLVFFDKLNHASLYQAIFLSDPELHRYNHNDVAHLAYLLEKYKHDPRPKFIVSETVFGMDGDIAPLTQLVALAKQQQAFLYLDEAHATGLFGAQGYGLSTDLDLHTVPHIIMGTFSKAIGGSGGYIACDKLIRDLLINKASGFIYTTASSPSAVGAAYQAWQMVRALNPAREHLQALGNRLRKDLNALGFNTGTSTTHILPIILGAESHCIQAKEALYKEKIIVSAIRPPTVPPNSARLRIALNAAHTSSDIERLITTLSKVLQ